jgi:hypothetical protein
MALQVLAEHIGVGYQDIEDLRDIPGAVVDREIFPRRWQPMRARQPDLDDSRYPVALAEIASEDFRRHRERYMTDTRSYREDKPFFIDKMPNNFRHIGLIHLMMPNAKIIDARREPMACCFSNLKQLFATGQEFTYSIEDIARYYRTYLHMMRHWDALLPGRILRVWYDDVVEDLEGNVRRILEFCGLEFEPACTSSTRQNAVSARQAQSRSASRFSPRDSSSGGTTSPGSARSRTVWTMH